MQLKTTLVTGTSGPSYYRSTPKEHQNRQGYWSPALNNAETAYDTKLRDFSLSYVPSILLRPYFEGSRFTVRTDHDGRQWKLNKTDTIETLTR